VTGGIPVCKPVVRRLYEQSRLVLNEFSCLFKAEQLPSDSSVTILEPEASDYSDELVIVLSEVFKLA
jgi:hypothetical protein